ncbi:MAG: histidinol dehydrogenase [Blastocatellia bacterium]|nr:histidinol dehydrogenase [Blastocatellia bacterium]
MDILRIGDEASTRHLEHILSRSQVTDETLNQTVADILRQIRENGDTALCSLTQKFDQVVLTAETLRVSPEQLETLASQANPNVRQALRQAIENVRAYHERQLEASWMWEQPDGVKLGHRLNPLDAVGLYVPGGRAAYPSSVVMNAIPAQVAGVPRIVAVTPPGNFQANPMIAAALVDCGVTEVYTIGGAQAVAALAYGTETIRRVDKIVGPGNIYVTAAKRQLFGVVDIDAIAGPSEVVVLADETARADYVAADMLAQAEHDEEAAAVCITTSLRLAEEVREELNRQAAKLSRRPTVLASLHNYGGIFLASDLNEACQTVNHLAPEHLEIMTADPETVAARIRHAGAIFLGDHTPEPVGDYFAGPSHVLPTGGTARFFSPLGVYDFVRRTSIIYYSPKRLAQTADAIIALAECEGLDGHAQAVRIRMN